MNAKGFSTAALLRFVVPSAIGLGLFIVPVPQEETYSIPVAVMAGYAARTLSQYQEILLVAIITLSVLLSLFYRINKPAWMERNPFLRQLFAVNLFWLCVRTIGLFLAWAIYLQVGPEIFISKTTGKMLFDELLPVLLSVFLAGALLPLLLTSACSNFWSVTQQNYASDFHFTRQICH